LLLPRGTLKKPISPISSRAILISRPWEGSRGTATNRSPCSHRQHTQAPLWHSHPPLVSTHPPRYIPTRPVSCDAPPTATHPTCRANDGDTLSPTPSATDRLSLSGRFPVKEEAATGIAQVHTRALTYSVILPSPGTRDPLFRFARP
jgi:hypothetical protein